MSKFRPLNDRVVIRKEEAATVTAGGIYIPENAKEKPLQGTIVAVGPGLIKKGEIVAPRVKVGEKVVFGKFAGTEVKDGDAQYVIVKEIDILAVIVDEITG